jgi:N-acetylmuramoyl-L-alanine amidase
MFLLLASTSIAEEIAFLGDARGESKRAQVAITDYDGITYVSLESLVTQLGGGTRTRPGRVQLDLLGHTAWLDYNDTWVDGSLNEFALAHPVLRVNGEVRIAVSDVSTLFNGAFGIALRQQTLDTTPPPVAEPELGSTETLLDSKLPTPPANVSSTIQGIVIDPGHGGADTGVRGAAGLLERDLTYQLAERLGPLLEKSTGVPVRITRGDANDAPSLRERASLANTHAGSGGLFISLHAGASYAPGAHGFELFAASEDAVIEESRRQRSSQIPLSQRRAYAQQSQALAESVGLSLRKHTESTYRGLHRARWRVLRTLTMPGILIEVGVLTNAAEEALLQTPEYQDKLAAGIAEGVRRYMNRDALERGQQ